MHGGVRTLTAISNVAAMSRIVSQKRELLPVEAHETSSKELHPCAPAICDDYVRPQSQDRQQHEVSLDEEPRVDLRVGMRENGRGFKIQGSIAVTNVENNPQTQRVVVDSLVDNGEGV